MLNPADDSFAAICQDRLPQDILQRPSPRHLEEPRRAWSGSSQWVALPHTTDDVSQIVKLCAKHRVGILPYGGGTGLVGGQVAPTGAPLLVSLERMSRIRDVRPNENSLIAESGAILQDVQDAAKTVDRLFALSLASQGSARIGGLLSTNAGGVNVLRYGNAREQVLGLEAVLPDGSIWNGLKRLRKDNTGYDLKHLLMGAEGTLGIITAAVLKLAPIPASTGTAIFQVKSPAAALDLLALARDQLGDMVSGFELIGKTGLEFLAQTLPDIRQPWKTPPEWCVLVDLGLATGMDAETALADLFETALEAGLTKDGVIAQSVAQSQAFWAIREHIPDANRAIGAIASHDVSLPLDLIPEFIETAPSKIAAIADMRINCFGHLGDGNLHYNVFPQPGKTRDNYKGEKSAITAAIHDLIDDMGGSFSAEHGIGRLKSKDLAHYGDPAKLAAMRAIKDALDPNGIMNPGAVFA